MLHAYRASLGALVLVGAVWVGVLANATAAPIDTLDRSYIAAAAGQPEGCLHITRSSIDPSWVSAIASGESEPGCPSVPEREAVLHQRDDGLWVVVARLGFALGRRCPIPAIPSKVAVELDLCHHFRQGTAAEGAAIARRYRSANDPRCSQIRIPLATNKWAMVLSIGRPMCAAQGGYYQLLRKQNNRWMSFIALPMGEISCRSFAYSRVPAVVLEQLELCSSTAPAVSIELTCTPVAVRGGAAELGVFHDTCAHARQVMLSYLDGETLPRGWSCTESGAAVRAVCRRGEARVVLYQPPSVYGE